MSRRIVPQQAGLSYVDVNKGRITTEGPDVLDLKRQIRELWNGTLEAYFDWEQREWIIVENRLDGVQDLVTTCKPHQFNDRLLDRLREAANTTTVEAMNYVDAFNEKREAELDKEFYEITGDAGERLMHAFKKDGLYDHCDIYGGSTKKSRRYAGKGVRAHSERRVA